jgi:hypothetical protein
MIWRVVISEESVARDYGYLSDRLRIIPRNVSIISSETPECIRVKYDGSLVLRVRSVPFFPTYKYTIHGYDEEYGVKTLFTPVHVL